ncbi:hypothetical protein SAMN06265364_10566 [Prevotella jejuni]|uniref:Uncharacterized protein n=1 Tax=Prevotella jejuni TaxID=1177574 RepID=A0AA94IT60_9BACT|nr:hypothetical protein SAMN06265364_10566 [Prevotella jejuni]
MEKVFGEIFLSQNSQNSKNLFVLCLIRGHYFLSQISQI